MLQQMLNESNSKTYFMILNTDFLKDTNDELAKVVGLSGFWTKKVDPVPVRICSLILQPTIHIKPLPI